MRVFDTWEPIERTGVVLTIGNFDGVHLGHQAILAAGRRRADQARAELVVMTFNPHPLSVLTPEHVPPVLTPLPEKLRRLELAGADAAVVVHPRPELLGTSAEAFTREVIVERFHPAAVVEGSSFRFGQHRQGDVHSLRSAGTRYGFEVIVVEPVRAALGGHPDAVISSSLVRQLVCNGTVDRAARCLGRPYALLGTVGRGSGRGRHLGFPTLNLQPAEQLIPAEGVYVGRVILARSGEDGGVHPPGTEPVETYAAAVSIGRCPTFQGKQTSIEAHLLGFAGDLYGQTVRVELLDWLREQRVFDSSQALRDQIERDIDRLRESFREHQE